MKRRALPGASSHSKSFGRIGVSSPILADCELTYDLCQRAELFSHAKLRMLNGEAVLSSLLPVPINRFWATG